MQAPGTHDWLPTPTTALQDAAALYIAHGLRTVILHGITASGACTCGRSTGGCKPGKHPAANAWQKKVYQTVDDFRDALTSPKAPSPANLGIVLGEQLTGDYLLAVDGDDVERMAVLEAALGALPVTLTARTGGGGSHRLLALGAGMDPKRLRNRVGLRLPSESPSPGVDVRVAGGQVAVCPSLHVSGQRYSWSVAAPIAELPQAWFDVMAEPVPVARAARTSSAPGVTNLNDRYIARVIERAAQDIAGRGKGERNGVLFSKSCTVLEYCAGAGLAFAHALGELRSAGVACGLPKAEVDDVLRKAERQVRSSGKTRVPPPPSPRGVATTAATHAPAADVEAEPESEAVDWMEELARSKQGNIKNTLGNAVLIVRHDDFFKGRVSFNRMRVTPCIDGSPLKDADLARFRVEMEKRWGFAPGKETMADAIVLAGDERSFHPVQDYLTGLAWDGEARIARVASEVLGISSPDAMTDRVVRAWFVSAVARALRPGCKVDTGLILVGSQGAKKSGFFKTLFGPEWFGDSPIPIGDKDAAILLQRVWGYEAAEMEDLSRKTAEAVKQFMSTAADIYRSPYERSATAKKRRTDQGSAVSGPGGAKS